MAWRTCDNCGVKMSPWRPRRRKGDQLVCDGCHPDGKGSPGRPLQSMKHKANDDLIPGVDYEESVCPNCGKVEHTEAEMKRCMESMIDSRVRCPNCGAPNDDNRRKSCALCGETLARSAGIMDYYDVVVLFAGAEVGEIVFSDANLQVAVDHAIEWYSVAEAVNVTVINRGTNSVFWHNGQVRDGRFYSKQAAAITVLKCRQCGLEWDSAISDVGHASDDYECPNCGTDEYVDSVPDPFDLLAVGSKVAYQTIDFCTEDHGAFRCHYGHLPSETGIQRAAARKVAHDSGDGETIYHCPFCGSGQVVQRSDKTVECSFCNNCFTVQVQPKYPSMPQTVNGQPIDVPGMPGDATAPPEAQPGQEPPAVPGEAAPFVPPGAAPGFVPPAPKVPTPGQVAARRTAGRFPCPGSNSEPLPPVDDAEYTMTVVSEGGSRIGHPSTYGVCSECREPKPLLKSGRLPKHTRYLSWQQQGEMGLRPTSKVAAEHAATPQDGREDLSVTVCATCGKPIKKDAGGWTHSDEVPNHPAPSHFGNRFYSNGEVALPEESYIKHLAIKYADDKAAVLQQVRTDNGG